jgi:hypothetical protein
MTIQKSKYYENTLENQMTLLRNKLNKLFVLIHNELQNDLIKFIDYIKNKTKNVNVKDIR